MQPQQPPEPAGDTEAMPTRLGTLLSAVQALPPAVRGLLLAALVACAAWFVLSINPQRLVGPVPGTVSMVERVYGQHAPLVWGMLQAIVGLIVIGLFAWPAAILFPAHRRAPKVASYEFWLDVIYAHQGLWVGAAGVFVAVTWIAERAYGNAAPWIPALGNLPFWLQVVVGVWAFDFIVYWRHRFEHQIAALWSFHAVHHTTGKVDFLTTLRLHPLELALGSFLNAIVYQMGISGAAAALAFGIYLKWNYFIHTNVRIRFPGFMKYVLVSPFMHHWHHAKDIASSGKNVGVVFAWNDFLFGTAHHPDHWPPEYGMTVPRDEEVGQSYLRHLLYPLQFGWARLRAWRNASAVRDPSAAQEGSA